MIGLLLALTVGLPAGIPEVRTVVAQVETAHRQGRLTEETHVMPDSDNWYNDTTCYRWRDASGTVRRLTYDGGSGDSTMTLAQTYDAAGHLRFVFWRGGAINNTYREIRLYFNPAGDLLQRLNRQDGSGYPFPDPAEQLILTARQAAEAPC